jgi:hypothetical protein
MSQFKTQRGHAADFIIARAQARQRNHTAIRNSIAIAAARRSKAAANPLTVVSCARQKLAKKLGLRP